MGIGKTMRVSLGALYIHMLGTLSLEPPYGEVYNVHNDTCQETTQQ